ncbi:MAG: hypothetical protein J6C25_11660 [Treponema sp.]|nr:hypothetical protein [Treponema sp.]
MYESKLHCSIVELSVPKPKETPASLLIPILEKEENKFPWGILTMLFAKKSAFIPVALRENNKEKNKRNIFFLFKIMILL